MESDVLVDGYTLEVHMPDCDPGAERYSAVARLAAYPVERLEVESPFLRSWLEEVRAMRRRVSASGSEERTGSGSERR